MRTITKTHTGKIISDTDLTLEYLYVGDYGKENNIKASFLGYDKRIDKVEHQDVDLSEKLVVTAACASMVKFGGKGKQEIYDYVCRFYGDENKYKYPISMSLNDMRQIYKWDVSCQGVCACRNSLCA